MIDFVLVKYWMPANTPFSKHHLPVILIGTVLIVVPLVLRLYGVEAAIVGFVVMVTANFILSDFAKRRFGSTAPKGSSYYNG